MISILINTYAICFKLTYFLWITFRHSSDHRLPRYSLLQCWCHKFWTPCSRTCSINILILVLFAPEVLRLGQICDQCDRKFRIIHVQWFGNLFLLFTRTKTSSGFRKVYSILVKINKVCCCPLLFLSVSLSICRQRDYLMYMYIFELMQYGMKNILTSYSLCFVFLTAYLSDLLLW